MSIVNNLHPGASIRSFPLGDQLLLFDENSGRMFCINAAAEVIWKGCQAGLSSESIIDTLQRATGAQIERIADDVHRTLSEWQVMGLLQAGPNAADVDRQPAIPEAAPGPQIAGAEIDSRTAILTGGCQCLFRLIDTCFRLRVPLTEAWQCVMPIFAHLSTSATAPCKAEFNIVRSESGYALFHNGVLIDRCRDATGIAPMAHGNSLLVAYESSRCLLGLHAAAVVHNHQSILMPAVSGSGKSTLTAALIGGGFQYCADDLVLLTPAPIRMRPVPAAIGLKSGSWPPLQAYHAKIASLRTHIRTDGKHIRYLVPPESSLRLSGELPLPVNHIVFPHYDANTHDSVLTPTHPADGLCRLAAAGYDVRGCLTADIVGQMIAWISDIPCYELRFNRLEDAVSILLSLIES